MVPHDPPLTCPDLPGTGGRIGPAPEDFRVDEIGAYPLCGEGDHLFARLEKRGWNTADAARALARAAGVRPNDVGTAGMKDRHAVTTQWVSLPARDAAPPESWELPEGLAVVEVTRHKNKLRTGHLAGNRFALRLVDVAPDAESRARAILERLSSSGLVNYFGAQRFGRGGSNLPGAVSWLGRPGGPGRDRFQRKLYPSVLQAEVFNRFATPRAALGTTALLAGDVVRLAGSSAVFVVEDPVREQPRLDARDVLLTGPIFGPKSKRATGEPGRLEAAALAELDLSDTAVSTLGRLAPGTRRDLLVFPADVSVVGQDDGLLVCFTLPAGSYATQVVRELTREPFLPAAGGRSGEKAGSGSPD